MKSKVNKIIVMSLQNLSQTHMLIDLIQEVKEKGYKLRICPPVETNLVLFICFYLVLFIFFLKTFTNKMMG